jgi:hypothetical protein
MFPRERTTARDSHCRKGGSILKQAVVVATIACASKLWRVVRAWDLAGAPTPEDSELLGPWAATRFKEDELDLVVAISAPTYLTIVIPLNGAAAMSAAFPAALGEALQDLRIQTRRIDIEVAAASSLSLCLLREHRLSAALEYIKAFCGVELCYHTDLRVVQRNLNELPHGDLEACVPADAVTGLLGQARREWTP